MSKIAWGDIDPSDQEQIKEELTREIKKDLGIGEKKYERKWSIVKKPYNKYTEFYDNIENYIVESPTEKLMESGSPIVFVRTSEDGGKLIYHHLKSNEEGFFDLYGINIVYEKDDKTYYLKNNAKKTISMCIRNSMNSSITKARENKKEKK